jgi:tetratricopeptide (TPR) repeat protein
LPEQSDPPKWPDGVEVRRALDSALAAESFRDSPQLRAFLTYVVSEKLAGREADLKGYSIATLALGRPDSFDPQSDPIVRVQAGRVRQALAEHYAAHPDSPVIIQLERGSYAPMFLQGQALSAAAGSATGLPAVFPPSVPASAPAPAVKSRTGASRRMVLPAGIAAAAAAGGLIKITGWPSQPSAPESPAPAPALALEASYPTLVVEPDEAGTYLDISITAARVRDAIARFDDLVVVGEGAAASATPADARRRPGWDMILRINGNPADAGMIRLSARLLDRADKRLIWSREFEPFPAGPAGDAARTAIIRSIASAVAQPYGVIHAYIRSRADGTVQPGDPYGCMVATFDYWQTNDSKAHAVARSCIIERLKTQSSVGPLHAQLSYLHLEEFRHGYNPLPGDPLARAVESARTAVRLSPSSARAHQALLAARFSRRDMEGAWTSAKEALRLNPYDTDIMADVGARHIQSGRYEKGLELLKEAFELNHAPPIWASTYQAIGLYMLDRLTEASHIAAQLEDTSYPPAMVATILVAYQERKPAKGKERLAVFRSRHPEIAADLESYLGRLNVDADFLKKAMTSYRDALAWIDQQ